MSKIIEVKVPDIGDFKDVPIIEVMVKPGDRVKVDDSLVTLESDKATMEVPSPAAGVVKTLEVKVGDKVAEGVMILTLEVEGAVPAASAGRDTGGTPVPPQPPQPAPAAAVAAPAPAAAPGGLREVRVPDIGDFKDVPIIEVMVKAGDTVKVDDALVTLESDKATMEVPSTAAGVVKSVAVKVGDKVSEGTLIVTVEGAGAAAPAAGRDTGGTPVPPTHAQAPAAAAAAPVPQPAGRDTGGTPVPPPPMDQAAFKRAHASPSMRLFARELGLDLTRVKGSGPKGRIQKEDIQAFVKQALAAPPAAAAVPAGGAGLNLLPWPDVDFTKFGPIETKPLSRIKKISAANLSRNWMMIPGVTYHEDADITDLEAFRVQLNKENEKSGAKVTMLAFLIKASVAALKKFPEFNASLDKTGENLVLKGYWHIGFAADTPNGLVVPVIRDADRKGVLELAKETADLSKKARDGKLAPAEMQGACFTISSLGGIGGTHFSPIINAPEVAILGVNKSVTKPVWDGKQFVPRLILPLSLTADHRVIDGAAATRFNVFLAQLLADMRRVLI